MARDWQSQDLNLRGLATELTSLGKVSERPLLSQGPERRGCWLGGLEGLRALGEGMIIQHPSIIGTCLEGSA